MATIFVSYRREDSSGYTGRLHDRFVQRWGGERVFMDIDSIDAGEDFVEAINRVLAQCAVVVVVVGPQWLAKDSAGRRRIDNASDYHRMEIEAGLKRAIRVIPVLVGGAGMPAEADLPESLKAFARRNAMEVSDRRFGFDVGKLLDAVDRALENFERVSAQPTPAPAKISNEDLPSQQRLRPQAPSFDTPPEGTSAPIGATKPARINLTLLLVGALVAAIAIVVVIPKRSSNTPPPNESTHQTLPTEPRTELLRTAPTRPTPESAAAQPSSAMPPSPVSSTTASVAVAEQRKQAWVSAEHTGHYHEAAASARAVIHQVGTQFRLFLDAPQAKFDCDLEFGSDGDPKFASACKVAKYDYAGNVQPDVHWWTNDRITFACGVSKQKEVCRGSYMLHFARGAEGNEDSWPAERRTMRIERQLNR